MTDGSILKQTLNKAKIKLLWYPHKTVLSCYQPAHPSYANDGLITSMALEHKRNLISGINLPTPSQINPQDDDEQKMGERFEK